MKELLVYIGRTNTIEGSKSEFVDMAEIAFHMKEIIDESFNVLTMISVSGIDVNDEFKLP